MLESFSKLTLSAMVLAASVAASRSARAEPGIAILGIETISGAPLEEGDQIVEMLAIALSQNVSATVEGRRDLLVRAQKSDCVDNTCLGEIARALGYRFIVGASLGKLGDRSLLYLRLFAINGSDRVLVRRHSLSGASVDEVALSITEASIRPLIAGVPGLPLRGGALVASRIPSDTKPSNAAVAPVATPASFAPTITSPETLARFGRPEGRFPTPSVSFATPDAPAIASGDGRSSEDEGALIRKSSGASATAHVDANSQDEDDSGLVLAAAFLPTKVLGDASDAYGFGYSMRGRLGYEFAHGVTITPEMVFDYTTIQASAAQASALNLMRGMGGLRLGLDTVVSPGLFGDVGFGRASQSAGAVDVARSGLTFETGAFIDVRIGVFAIGVEGGYNQLIGDATATLASGPSGARSTSTVPSGSAQWIDCGMHLGFVL